MQTHEIMWSLAIAHPLDQLIVDMAVDSTADAEGRLPEEVRADLDACYDSMACHAVAGPGRAASKARRALIKIAGFSLDVRPTVEVIPGTAPATRAGTVGGHYTASGLRVRRPGACRKAGSRIIYHPSTLRVTVGARWLVAWLHDAHPAALAPLLTHSHEG